jgi:hypothetical protein
LPIEIEDNFMTVVQRACLNFILIVPRSSVEQTLPWIPAWSGSAAPAPDHSLGIKRTFRQSPARKVPATSDKVRDRALLLLGFAGAIRRSELIALNLEDLEFCEHSLLVMLRKSKTDQEGEGATVAIARGSSACPVNAVCDWIAAS